MDRTKLAALANELGGTANAANELGVDKDILESAIRGENLSRFDRSEIDIAYGKFEQDTDESYLQYIDETAEKLFDSQLLLADTELANNLAESFADGRISEPQLYDLYELWGELTPYQADLVVNWLNSDKSDAGLLTELYLEEADLFENYKDSEFWEWFRDTFYKD